MESLNHFDKLRELAPTLNRLIADPEARVHYELFSDSLIWSDEWPPPDRPDLPGQYLRGVFHYRTTLILGRPQERYREGWDLLAELCPNWPGFLPERRQPDAARIRLYQERRVQLHKDWEDLDVKYRQQQAAKGSSPAA